MKVKIARQIIKYFSLFALFSFAVLPSAAEAQTGKRTKTKRPPASDTEFSVPCAKALNIGLERVEKLHSKDIEFRNRGHESDSDTELLIEKNAFENYLRCRRADTAKKLKRLSAGERGFIIQEERQMRQLARMRVDLIYGVQFDERYDDPVNYVISQRAVILVEDHKAELTSVYLETRDYNAYGNTEAGERNVRQIGGLLKRIEELALESSQAAEFAAFKTEIGKKLAEIRDEVGNEKRVMSDFLVQLLKMNLPNEN